MFEAKGGAADPAHQVAERNHLLQQARLRRRSPSHPTQSMSQRELAEAVTAHVQRATGRDVALDRHYISRLERGGRRWPMADYRNAFRAVLGVATDAELGFYVKRRPPPLPPDARSSTRIPTTVVSANGAGAPPTGTDSTAQPLAISPGTAVILMPATPELLTAIASVLAALANGTGEPSTLTTSPTLATQVTQPLCERRG